MSYVERPDVELEYGLRYDARGRAARGGAPSGPSEGRLQVAAALELANPFGWGWRFGAYTLQTSARHNYRFGLESSTLFGRRVSTQLLVFDETDDESAIAASFASKVRGFSVQQSRTLLRDTGAAAGTSGCACSGATRTRTSGTARRSAATSSWPATARS